MTEHRDAWAIALRLQEDSPSSGARDSQLQPKDKAAGEEDQERSENPEGSENDDSDDEANNSEAGGETANDATDNEAETPIASLSFARFLDFISTICPTIPQLTYPILLVAVSTIPDDILSLNAPPSSILQSFFAHLWSPVDARLLATHTYPGQLSAFQTFLQDAIDITCWMIRKSCSSGTFDETARWLATEQLGRRVWAEGVLGMGGKSARRGQKAIETEAERFGLAVSRLDTQLLEELLSVMNETTLDWCFAASDTRKSIESNLPRLPAIIAATRGTHEVQTLESGLDQVTSSVCSKAVPEVAQAAEENSPATTILAEFLIEVLRTRPDLLSDSLQPLTQFLQSSLRLLVKHNMSSQVLLTLLAAVVDTTGESEQEPLRMALWRLVVDPSVDSTSRFSLAHQLLTMRPANLMSDDLFESIALEAAQASMEDQSSVASDLAILCVDTDSPVSPETRQEILLLASTYMHDAVQRELYRAGSQVDLAPASTAPRLLATYAKHSASDLMSSDIHIQAFVAAHHLTHLLPATVVPPAWQDVEQEIRSLAPAQQGVIADAITASLADLLAAPGSPVSPRTLVDASLRLLSGTGSSSSSTHGLESLLPSAEAMDRQIASTTRLPPNSGLHALDALIPVSQNEPAADTSFDFEGRSALARQIEAVLALIQDDRTLVAHRDILSYVLYAAQLAQEALWSREPGCARGMYASTTESEHLQLVIREAEGALSYALASIDATVSIDLAWHKTTVDLLKNGSASEGQDYLQKQIVRLANTVRDDNNDVAARVLRTILARHLQRSGAGVAEGEVWLNFGMSISEKSTFFPPFPASLYRELIDHRSSDIARDA